VKNTIYAGKNFHGLLVFAAPKDGTPQNFAEKTFANSHKTAKSTKLFSLKSFPLYGIALLATPVPNYSEMVASSRPGCKVGYYFLLAAVSGQ